MEVNKDMEHHQGEEVMEEPDMGHLEVSHKIAILSLTIILILPLR
jgi:hypothetical protein